MKRNTGPRRGATPWAAVRTLPKLWVGLAFLQFGIALVALGLDLFALCRACSKGTDLHLLIAGVGCGAYLVLATIGMLDWASAFYLGVFMAGAVHTALSAWMATASLFCPPCVASAAVAFLLMGLVLASRKVDFRLAEMAFLPTVLAASGASFAAIAAEGSREARHEVEERRFKAAQGRHDRRDPTRALIVSVFESPECGYCREFRETYLPRLEEDFGARLRVEFLPARETAWVRRTPTIVIEDGPTFEGLPPRYEDLETAVGDAFGKSGEPSRRRTP